MNRQLYYTAIMSSHYQFMLISHLQYHCHVQDLEFCELNTPFEKNMSFGDHKLSWPW